jgi:toxin ParE1/3/4
VTLPVVILFSAEQDLRELKAYVRKNFGAAAWRTSYEKIKSCIATIGRFPREGSVPEELTGLHLTQYRQVISGVNRIIYEIRGEAIYIHVICDARRDMVSLLTRRMIRG